MSFPVSKKILVFYMNVGVEFVPYYEFYNLLHNLSLGFHFQIESKTKFQLRYFSIRRVIKNNYNII